MSAQTIYSSDGFLIEHLAAINTLKGSFVNCENSGDYIAAIKAFKEIYERVKPQHTLWDNTSFRFEIHPDLQIWTDTFLNNPCWQMGYTSKVGILVGAETIGISSILNMFEDGAASFRPHFFLHEHEAVDWFLQKTEAYTLQAEPKISIREATNGRIDLSLEIAPGDLSYYLKVFSRPASEVPPITLREKEVLIHMAHGLGIKEIADKMKVAESTIITHRKNLMMKTNSKNGIELIVYCIRNQII